MSFVVHFTVYSKAVVPNPRAADRYRSVGHVYRAAGLSRDLFFSIYFSSENEKNGKNFRLNRTYATPQIEHACNTQQKGAARGNSLFHGVRGEKVKASSITELCSHSSP